MLNSKCCNAILNTHNGEDGTNCYICTKCGLPSDPIIKSPEDFKEQFEAIKHYQCPDCKRRGKHGTLELLTEDEMQKLKDKEGYDKYPDRIYGCDECAYWCDEDFIDEL